MSSQQSVCRSMYEAHQQELKQGQAVMALPESNERQRLLVAHYRRMFTHLRHMEDTQHYQDALEHTASVLEMYELGIIKVLSTWSKSPLGLDSHKRLRESARLLKEGKILQKDVNSLLDECARGVGVSNVGELSQGEQVPSRACLFAPDYQSEPMRLSFFNTPSRASCNPQD